MRDVIYVTKVNEVYMRVSTEPSVAQEIADLFSFMSPNAKFDPRVRNKMWDGRIRLFSTITGLLYIGLLDRLKQFALLRGYDVEVDFTVEENQQPQISTTVKEPRPYQSDAVRVAVERTRGVFLSPTSSGKSMIIYLLAQHYNQHKKLIIVPRVGLALQLRADFEEYAGKALDIHCITAGVDKQTDSPIVISTWQSIYKMPKQWFQQFGVVIGDEVHEFEAKSLRSIMEKLVDTKYRFGFTGTLKGTLTNEVTLEGLFGSIHTVTTMSELQENNYVAQLKIKCIVLKYPQDVAKDVIKYKYPQEAKYINDYRPRNNFIAKLAVSCEKNALVLFRNIDHGKLLYDKIKSYSAFERDVYLIYGGVDVEDREEIRKLLDTKSNAILVASYGTFSTGVNVPNLHHVILGSPSKSRVKVLQSIGRGLRLHNEKDYLTVYDIADDIRYKGKSNFTLQHFAERIDIYNNEGFVYRIYNTEI